MKPFTPLLTLLTLTPLSAQTINVVDHLQRTRQMFLNSIAGLSEVQWKFKPAPDRWSVAECAEHIAASEDFLFQLVSEKVMKSPAASDSTAAKVDDAKVLQVVTDRSVKAKAPEPVQPTGRWATRDALLRQFQQSRDRTT